jgi:hypothetical protein
MVLTTMIGLAALSIQLYQSSLQFTEHPERLSRIQRISGLATTKEKTEHGLDTIDSFHSQQESGDIK